MKDSFLVHDKVPELGKSVLARYLDHCGKPTFVIAKYIPGKTIESFDDDDIESVYDEETDTSYLPEGWYEQIRNWGEYSQVIITDHKVTHWMPIPEL